jgi:GT2 family glycosyltransferase
MITIPIIAVLLTCHNRKDKTLQCLSLLFRQKSLEVEYKIEVFLVDDGSTDGTAEAIQTKFPNVNIIKGNGNLFWNRGMHLAWKTAAATKEFDYYLWLNDDTFLFEEALLNLLSGSQLSNNKAAICGSTISLSTQSISYGGNSLAGTLLIPNGELQETFSFNGNVVLIPKGIYERVGILDKRFPHAIGDYEYALRIRKYNLKSFIASNYVGSCEGNEKLPSWCSTSISLRKRVRSLYSPLGNSHPYYFFIFEHKYYGLFTAVKHFVSIHLRLLIPQLWKQ